jgi:hypothetical protein
MKNTYLDPYVLNVEHMCYLHFDLGGTLLVNHQEWLTDFLLKPFLSNLFNHDMPTETGRTSEANKGKWLAQDHHGPLLIVYKSFHSFLC